MKNIEWGNKCKILKTYIGSSESDILLKCENVPEAFRVFDSTNSRLPDGTKAKIVIGCLGQSKNLQILNDKKRGPNILIKQSPPTNDNYIHEAVGKVIRVLEGTEGDGRNKIIVDVKGLLVETIDEMKIKAGIGDLVKLGLIDYCWGVYPIEIPFQISKKKL